VGGVRRRASACRVAGPVAGRRRRGSARSRGRVVGMDAFRLGRPGAPARAVARRPARHRGRRPMITFVRHGETAHNAGGRLQGRADVELSARGLEQVARLATRLATYEIAGVYSSPLRRARQTAMAIAAVAGCEVEVDDRLIELDYGDWDGRPLGEIGPDAWAAWRADPSFAPPGGESLQVVTARIDAFCRERFA